ncbi:actin patches distal protein [Ophiostoma piceae UAMH 11346]|uniref:Actin patches distal protein n=1 Tax=Ophiostoma piceae (strain UAMH 11346) TaxID=1262450 RepID=S3CF17_OPHP1|nr:actin patches distal protein [Ophiostoma piceae UAMH 11346]
MSFGFRSLIDGAKKLAINGAGSHPAQIDELFHKTDPAVDGDDCSHDCSSCTIKYPRSFKIDVEDKLYGFVKGWSTHMLVATGKMDWVRDVADEKGSVMEAVQAASNPTNGNLMLSASNIPTPSHSTDYAEPTTVLLLPAFVVVENVTPSLVPSVIEHLVNKAPTNTTIPSDAASPRLPPPTSLPPPLTYHHSPHSVLVLLCSQKTRDARCGQSAPLIRKELERHLRPLGLYRDLDDERPGGVGIYFISHVGGHKYSANMMIYRRPDAFGIDNVARGKLTQEQKDALPAKIRSAVPAVSRVSKAPGPKKGTTEAAEEDPSELNVSAAGASQCMWLARVMPEDCENIVKYTILQGKVVKPDSQLRAGFDREKGLMSW